MKRSTIWGLAITLVLGCWAGSASARPLEASSALLLPYYETNSNLATIIGVQHVGDVPTGGEVSVINVAVYDGEDGVVEDLGHICLGQDEFGFVVLQSARPTQQDEDWGQRFSVEGDGIPSTGFVTLAYAGTRSSCGSGGGTTPSEATVMVAWAIIQDIGGGFFATEIPMLEVPWTATASPAMPAKGLEPYCYLKTDPSNNRIPLHGTAVFNDDKTACANPDTHTFVRSGPYCYANDDPTRAVIVATEATFANIIQLNDARNGCKEEFTQTFVPANTTLPEIPAVGPRADFTCADAAACPGLAVNVDPAPTIGARFDVERSNNSASHIYLWLSTAPPDGRETTGTVLDVVCGDGMMPTLTTSQLGRIDISGPVTEINPSGLGCSGRGVLELTLPRRAATAAVDERCYDPATPATDVGSALDADNNRCRTFRHSTDLSFDGTATDDAGCYDSSISYVFTRDINRNGVPNETDDVGCIQKGTPGPQVATVETPDSTNPTGCRSRSITPATDADIAGSATCKKFTYAADMTPDTPHGYIFSHISQAGKHYRMNFPGYAK